MGLGVASQGNKEVHLIQDEIYEMFNKAGVGNGLKAAQE
jgi:hypothetical protein